MNFSADSKHINKMFVYNHKKSEWKEVAGMKTPRSMFGAVVHKGQIIVVGGVNETGLLRSCEAYDFGTNKYVVFMCMRQSHLKTIWRKCI